MYRKVAQVINKQYVETVLDEGASRPVLQDDRNKEMKNIVEKNFLERNGSDSNIVDYDKRYIDITGTGTRGMRLA